MEGSGHYVDTERYAKCIEGSKRIRWDIDKDVIQGRKFDFSKKFLPDGITQLDQTAVSLRRSREVPRPDPGTDILQHVRLCRALHNSQDP